MDEGHRDHPDGLQDAYGYNLKGLVEREAALKEERQGQMNRMVEDVLKFRAALDAQYLRDIARIQEIGHESLQESKMDTRDAKMRKETGTEERGKELEEVFNKVVTAGANQQNVATNEAIAGVIAILEAAGLLAGVVGASQQTEGKVED
jgi:hypothetical protein